MRILFAFVLIVATASVALVMHAPYSAAPVIAAPNQPSPVVSVTTLPAVPSPHVATAPPTHVPTATPVTPAPASPTLLPVPVQPTQPPGLPPMPPGTAIAVGGLVANPVLLTLKDLQSMPHASLTLRIVDPDGRHRFHIFTGVLLRDIVERAHPNVPGGASNSTDAYVLVEGLNGGPAIVAFPEFESQFNGKRILVAYYQDSRTLTTPGIARLIVPEDNAQDRFVTGVTSITVGEPPR